MSNIILIGMPGAGKSTIGVLLAKALGYSFIDTDLLIQKKEKRLLQDIINLEGLDSFIKTEEGTIMSLNPENSVIATGGSVIYSKRSMNHLKNRGKILYLKLDYPSIVNRIKNITTRGIAANNGYSLYDLYIDRVPLYEEYADITINCIERNVEEIIVYIISILANTP